MERKTFKFEVKAVDEEEGSFTGYAATFSKKPDSYGDIIDEGAFKKTLKEGGKRIKSLWNHSVMEPIGKPTELAEDAKGLAFKIKLSLGVQRAREVLSLMKDGVITEMSIGYDTMKESFVDGIRHLEEIKLWDISPVTFAANPEALILGVKKATSFGNLPLADRDKVWDAGAAERRVRSWAGGEDNMNWNKYRQAFLWYDEGDSELFGSYKLGFADVAGGRLIAIPKGIFAVAGVLMGARGGVDIPAGEEGGVKSHADRYYAKMRKEFDDEDIIAPWKKSAEPIEMKPYPNEHACRLRDPDDFEDGSFRRVTRTSDGKKYSIIMGRLEGEETLTEQAYRYDKEVWEEGDAKAHCKEHDGTFEAAEKEAFKCECIECGHKLTSKKHCSDIECPKCGGKMRREERPGPGKGDFDARAWLDDALEGILAQVDADGNRIEKPDAKSGRVLSTANLEKVKKGLEALRAGLEALQALLDAAESEPEPAKATQLAEAKLEAAKLEGIVATLKAENEGFDAQEAERRIESILGRLRK